MINDNSMGLAIFRQVLRKESKPNIIFYVACGLLNYRDKEGGCQEKAANCGNKTY